MKLTYVFDAYCGWCYGFGPAMAELASQNWADVRVISAGLFPESASASLGSFPHIPPANARIAQLTGVTFGEPYERLVVEGSFIMNSDAAAVGLVALKEAGGDDVQMAHAMQRAFYRDGLDLSAPATYELIAQAEGLDPDAVLRNLGDAAIQAVAVAEQDEVRELGVDAYPTLLAHSPDGALYKIGGPTTSGSRLIELARSFSGEGSYL